jgi:diamine N-acetyltransferase
MVTPQSTVSLREVNEENLWPVINLSVTEAQERMVASNAASIAQAYFNRDIAWFRAIYAGDEPVGFLMLEDQPEKQEYFLWRLMIDARYQRMGFGSKAMSLLIDHVKTRPGAIELRTSYVPEEGGPGPFYRRLGFEETGEMLEGERVMSLKLTNY